MAVQEMTREELIERVEVLERTIEDWAPFVNQMRITLAQLAMNPMVQAVIPPQFRAELTKYLPPKS